MAPPQKTIIDTDPGIDDAMAILLALKAPEIDVIALTTVYGNHYVDLTTRNACRLLELADRPDIPVYKGVNCPLLKAAYDNPCCFFHGEDALGDAGLLDTLPVKTCEADKSAVQFIIDTVMANPGEITLLALGPLTNIALAFKLEPRIAANVKQFLFMGGSMAAGGNDSVAGEANIMNDPEAADIIFMAPWTKLVMVGLDVTKRILLSEEYFAELKASNTVYANIICKIAPHCIDACEKIFHKRLFQLHDPSAVMYAIDPTLFITEDYGIVVDTSAGICRGQTVADRVGIFFKDRPKTSICVDFHLIRLLDRFKSLYCS